MGLIGRGRRNQCLVAAKTRRFAAQTVGRFRGTGSAARARSARWACAATLLAAAACGSQASPLSVTQRAAIVDSVEAMLTGWRDALNARDFTRAGTYYANDPAFRWYEDGRQTYTSAQAIRDTMKAMAPGLRAFEMALQDPQISALAPGAAIVTTEFTEKLTDTTGNMIGFAGALSVVVVHADSAWRFLVGHTSSVRPPMDTRTKARGD